MYAAINPDLHGQSSTYDMCQDLGRASRSNETPEIGRYEMSDIDYRKLMRYLNEQQTKFVLDTVHHIKTIVEPIYRFLFGGAGTGKSYVLKALRKTLERYFRSRIHHYFRNRCTITVAPTGNAVFLAGGSTIHSVLHVPANQSLTYRRLDHDTLNSVRSCLQNVTVLVY